MVRHQDSEWSVATTDRGAGASLGATALDSGFDARLADLVLEYAETGDLRLPLDARLSLRGDLGIESLSLVSLVVRIGEELGTDIADRGVDLQGLRTVADLTALVGSLQQSNGHDISIERGIHER
jgi:acyl carrier protein